MTAEDSECPKTPKSASEQALTAGDGAPPKPSRERPKRGASGRVV
jgi:hypothetical protein